MLNFCHITPTAYLDQISKYRVHLLLAHMVEENEQYRNFYLNLKKSRPNTFYHLDNSCYELYRRGEPLYDPNKLIEMGKLVKADSIVMTDYPKESADKTIEMAKKQIPVFKLAGFKTFFCPQSQFNHSLELFRSFDWALNNRDIDYIGVSILAAPNGFGIEDQSNTELDSVYTDVTYRMQRYLSRFHVFNGLKGLKLLDKISAHKRFHCLGLLDGPREIELLKPFHKYIFSIDSSSAFHHATKGIIYDNSPTGLRSGKDESEFDFNYSAGIDSSVFQRAHQNRLFIDELCR